jgi:hypothetical protein
LPDVEFFINLGDWPLEKRSTTENPLPIFSWCGSVNTRDIVMPTYDITEATIEMMSRYDGILYLKFNTPCTYTMYSVSYVLSKLCLSVLVGKGELISQFHLPGNHY